MRKRRTTSRFDSVPQKNAKNNSRFNSVHDKNKNTSRFHNVHGGKKNLTFL